MKIANNIFMFLNINSARQGLMNVNVLTDQIARRPRRTVGGSYRGWSCPSGPCVSSSSQGSGP